MRLRRKQFAILKHLVKNPRRLITHDEIVEAVWGKMVLSESLVRTHVRHLRQALGEDIIETVVGRGYRFLADVTEANVDVTDRAASEGATVIEAFVARGPELDALDAAFATVRDGKRALVFVTGEPGIGKTTLADAFVERARAKASVFVARATCVEQYGSGEAFLPILDALGSLCRSRGGERVIDVLMRHAPTSLAQMPSLVAQNRLDELQRRVAGAAQPRMLREIADALDALSVDAPVILVLDDLQWSDPSSLDLLATLARRRDRARVLVVGTYRPSEVAPTSPLVRISDELVAHRQAVALHLEPFDAPALASFVARRFPGHTFVTDFESTVHQMTGGNPLFVATLLEELVSRGTIRDAAGGWFLATDIAHVAAQRPDGVRRLLDTQIGRLSPTEQRVLEAASVAGLTFTPAVVAHALDMPVDDIDSICETLADERPFLAYIGSEKWPDGAVHTRYAFPHALIQHAALARNPTPSLRLWHRKIAERLLSGYAGREGEVAGELAVHFDQGMQPGEAARYYVTAGERAAHRFGNVEATAHFERALSLIPVLPEGEDRERLELRAALGLGECLFMMRGLGALPALERARDLAAQLNDARRLAEAHVALQTCRVANGDLREARARGPEVASAVKAADAPSLSIRAQQMEVVAAIFRGRFDEARRAVEGLGLLRADMDVQRVIEHRLFPSVSNLSFLALLEGRADEAIALQRRAFAAADAAGDPYERCAVLCDWARLHAWRREPAEASELAARSLALAEEGSFAWWRDRAKTVLVWSRAHLSSGVSPEAAVDDREYRLWDSGEGGRTIFASLFAVACARLGRDDRALEVVGELLALIERTDERVALPELLRIRGEILARRADSDASSSIRSAIDIAKQQRSVLLELRASVSLHAMTKGADRKRVGDEIARLLSAFEQGRDLPDLVAARAEVEPRAARATRSTS